MESNHLDYDKVAARIASGDRLDSVKPLKIQVDPEGSCNHNCIHCNYRNVGWDLQYRDSSWWDGKRERVVPGKSGLSREVMELLVQSIDELQIAETELTGGGEPTIYPYFGEMLEGLGRTNTRVSIVTNGSRLHAFTGSLPSNVEWIRVSLDAATADTHALVHRARGYWNIVDTLLKLKATRPDIAIYVSFCVIPENLDEIVPAAEKYKDMGFDGVKFNATYTPTGDGGLTAEMVATARKASAAAESFTDSAFRVKNSFWKIDKYDSNSEFDMCHFDKFMVAVGYNGLVFPCCIVKNRPGYEYGDLRELPLEDILLGRKRIYRAANCPPCWSRDHNVKIQELLDA